MSLYFTIMIIWGVAALCGLGVAAAIYSSERGYGESYRKPVQKWLRIAAFSVLITPLWPIGFVFLVGYGVKTLWTWCFE